MDGIESRRVEADACIASRSAPVRSPSSLPSSSTPRSPISTWPPVEIILRTLERNEAFNQAELAITSTILPILRQLGSEEQMTYAVGLVEFKGHPAILLTSSQPERLVGQLDETYGSIEVKVLRGSVSSHASAHEDTAERSLHRKMGASLSPAGSHSAGTLGPYVQRKQSKVICALTCYHVAQEAPADLGTITRNPAEFDACDIVCPAEGDMATIHKELEERIADDQCWLETHSADPAGQRRAADLARAIAVNQAKIDKYRAQRVMGKVCAGHLRFPTATEMTYSDCALIEVADPGSVSTVFDTVGQDEDFCNRFMDPALLERTQRVTKFGRSTGSTSATVNGYRFAASMETPFGLAESFWAFAAWSEERHSAFTEKGDSGAAVVWERNIVGLVFGGIEGEVETSRGQRFVDITLFQSILDIAAILDIEPLFS